jgi:transcriptional regulator NrdR family protein
MATPQPNAMPGAYCPDCGCSHCPQMRGHVTVKRFGHEFTQRERECRACKTRFITEERVVRLIKKRVRKSSADA